MISAIVHTYNEENNLDRCLSSLTWVSEIMVVDMGSTDKTLQIASNYKAKIFPHPYTGFVEPARNFGIKKAQGPWILIVDADEEIPRTLENYLLSQTEDDSKDYFRIPRQNIVFGKWIKHSGWWPDYQIRFFKKGSVTWTDEIHGVPMTKGNGVDLEAEKELSIIHHNYQTIDQFITRLNRYTSIYAKELFIKNEKFSTKNLFQTPVKEFINRFFLWEGYKDGLHGVALSLLQAFSELIVYLKLWELEKFEHKNISLSEVENLIDEANSDLKYWFTTKKIDQMENPVEKTILKIKRKLQTNG